MARGVANDYHRAIVDWDADGLSRAQALKHAQVLIRAAQTFMIGLEHSGCMTDEVDEQIISDLILGIGEHVQQARTPRGPRGPASTKGARGLGRSWPYGQCRPSPISRPAARVGRMEAPHERRHLRARPTRREGPRVSAGGRREWIGLFVTELHALRNVLARTEGEVAELEAALGMIPTETAAPPEAAVNRRLRAALAPFISTLAPIERDLAMRRVALTDLLNDLDREGEI